MMLKKLLIYTITLLLLPTLLNANKLEDVKKAGVLKAGVKYDYEPFGFKDSHGHIVGFDIDLLKYIAKNLGVKLHLQQVTSKTRIPKLANGDVDIVAASMTHKVSRDATIDFTISYFFDGQAFLVREYSKMRKASSFNGKQVGAVEGATSGENLKKIVPKVRISYFKDYNKALKSLSKGQIDAITTDLVWCSVQAKKSNGKFKVLNDVISFEPYGIGVPENESKFRDAINFLLQKSVRDGTYNRLYYKWFHKDPERLPEVWPK